MDTVPQSSLIVRPGPQSTTVVDVEGRLRTPPAGWELLPPGDATLTRRVKAAGPSWTVQEKVGRRVFSRGVWASGEIIAAIRAELDAERASPAYEKKRQSELARRARKQDEYVVSFHDAVLSYLAFATQYADIAERLAKAVADHATPVGSGTVARTQRISIERRAEAAVIAWMRHQTTTYDNLKIARIKGERREVRRRLAQDSKRLLAAYREGRPIDPSCPLQRALGAV